MSPLNPFAQKPGQLRLHEVQLVHHLSEIVARLGGLTKGEALGIKVIGHAPITNPGVVNTPLPHSDRGLGRKNRLIPVTTISTCRPPQREQTSRWRQPSMDVSAPHRVAISAGLGST